MNAVNEVDDDHDEEVEMPGTASVNSPVVLVRFEIVGRREHWKQN